MNLPADLLEPVQLFSAPGALIREAQQLASHETPEPYRQLLAHQSHMTVVTEQYHQTPVTVQVLTARNEGGVYCRKILLCRSDTGQPVLFGIVRLALNAVSEIVREEILTARIPLGKVLINHDIPRRIQLDAIFKVSAGPELAELFQIDPGSVTYGRLATIACHDVPAVDLLEILSPLPLDRAERSA